MDYTKTGLLFKLSKSARYLRLYGLTRTVAKIRAQYHMKRKYATLPPVRERQSTFKHIGIIGCGNFSYSNIAYYLKKNYGPVIRGCMDVDLNRAASLFQGYDLDYYTDNSDEILADRNIDLIFIASNHASHAEYAIRALEAGKSVHIEKPHAVTEDQLGRLCSAMQRSAGKVTIGFNRPYSRIGKEIKQSLDAESGGAAINLFVVGHEIPPDHWYFNPEEGGRVLGNLCHWIDFVFQLVPESSRFPIEIVPVGYDAEGIVVAYCFPNDITAVITFSSKGYTFEGVREHFSAHRGVTFISMQDFKTVTVETLNKKRTINLYHRDHGHEEAIRNSYSVVKSGVSGCSLEYVWHIGMLTLQTRKALETNTPATVQHGIPAAYNGALARPI